MRFFAIVLAFVGVALLAINLYGYVNDLRPHDLHAEQTLFKSDQIYPAESYWRIISTPARHRAGTLNKLTKAVADSIAHYWKEDGALRYHLHIPIWENYILWGLGYIKPDYHRYEYCQPEKAVERGLGLCSQHAIILWDALHRLNIPAKIVVLDGHVVVTAELRKQPKRWWVLDPDFGIVMPHSLEQLEANPELIRSFYTNPKWDVDGLVKVYGPEGNRSFDTIAAYCGRKLTYEKLSYVLIWVIPAGLLIAAFILRLIARRRQRTQGD